MLKWTVMNKRTAGAPSLDPSIQFSGVTTPEHQADNRGVQRRHTIGKNVPNRRKVQRRHSHGTTASSVKHNAKCNKENQFLNSTPKSNESISYIRFDTLALRDVSNITPTNTPPNNKILCNKRCRSQPHENKYLSRKEHVSLRLSFTPPSHRNQPVSKKLCIRMPVQENERKTPRRSLQRNFEIATLSKNVLATYSGKKFEGKLLENVDANPLTIKPQEAIKNPLFSMAVPSIPLMEPKEIVLVENPLKGAAEKQNTYASTLPTFQIEYSPCSLRTSRSLQGVNDKISNVPLYPNIGALQQFPYFPKYTIAKHLPPAKKTKIDHVTDFLSQISNIASPEDIGMQFTRLNTIEKLKNDRLDKCKTNLAKKFSNEYKPVALHEKFKQKFVSVSPLANRFADLRFSKMSTTRTQNPEIQTSTLNLERSDLDDFDNLSLDQMVEAILETTETVSSTPLRTQDVKVELENDLNQSKEENFANNEQEKIKSTQPSIPLISNHDRTDRKFLGPKYASALSSINNNVIQSANIVKLDKYLSDSVGLDNKTLININESFNEREVKTPENKLKDSPLSPVALKIEKLNLHSGTKRKGLKRCNSDETITNLEQSFNLKRQKCVRRKRIDPKENINNVLTLSNGIPSPNSALKAINQNNSVTKSSTHDLVTIYQDPVTSKRRPITIPDEEQLTPKSRLNIDDILSENLEQTPLNLFPGYRNTKLKPLFGLTLPTGIPSPGTPVTAEQNPPKRLSETFLVDPERSQILGLSLSDGIPSLHPNKTITTSRSLEPMETPYSDAWTPVSNDKRIKSRRCLSFQSPDSSMDSERSTEKRTLYPFRRQSKEVLVAKGFVELSIRYENETILVHVIGCKDLHRANDKPINAYVKVALISGNVEDSATKERSSDGLQRTAVHKNSSQPHFDQIFSFSMVSKQDMAKRVQVAVWHRDREYRRSEFLGCMSFAVKHAIKKEISGQYKLLSQSAGRSQNILASSSNCQISAAHHQPISATATQLVPQIINEINIFETIDENATTQLNNAQSEPQQSTDLEEPRTAAKMGDRSLSSVEEIISLDEVQDVLGQDLAKPASKKKLNEQQRVADENLFLRYLELDPTEGPEAIPAALQRKASGNKTGRTPFTTTKRLVRPTDSGFGFSVVWTHPPRVERVERGLPADKAGILPGDYIIFVDKHNVVMMPEIDILNLIRSYGSQLTLEIFRRNAATTNAIPSQNGVLVSNSRSASVTILPPNVASLASSLPSAMGTFCTSSMLPGMGGGGASALSSQPPPQQPPNPRSSTACSINTTSDYNRRRLHLPQVTFSSENTTTSSLTGPEEIRRRTLYQLVHREQQYATAMQFSMSRFVSPLVERTDLLTPPDHKALFQNSPDLLHLTEEILDSIIMDDSEPQIHLIPKIYHDKLNLITALYKRYCTGLKRADCVLANKTRNTNSEFVRFLHNPAIPRRRPDITGFIHKPLEHYREVLKLLQTILSNTKSNNEEYQLISKVVQELQTAYREITSTAGLMEPVGEGRPLLSIQDLESRLVFTRCKPFVLNIPGRQWIFGGDLSRVEGRNIRPYWTLLFSDILLFAKVSRDRVLFITEEPLALINITDVFFNIRKKATEFRININPGGKPAESPTAHCGPDLSRTPRKNLRRRCVVLRTPTTELKAVWQNLLQKQIYLVHSGISGTPFSSPMDSPDVPITSSVATLQSGDSYSFRRQTPQPSNRLSSPPPPIFQKQLDELIEHKCRQLGKTASNKGSAIHLAQWMKGQLGAEGTGSVMSDDPEPEVWTEEELRRRSRELHLMDVEAVLKNKDHQNRHRDLESRCESVLLSDADGSPSKSTTSGSQVTVRSSPIVPEKVPVCRQCHKTCLSTHNSPNLNVHHTNNNIVTNENSYLEHTCNAENENSDNINRGTSILDDPYTDDWGSIMLMGLTAINPAASLLKMDPFAPSDVPEIAVLPPTPDTIPRSTSGSSQFPLTCDNDGTPRASPKSSPKRRLQLQKTITNANDESPEDSPLTEEPPYLVMVPKNPGLKRYGTWSSLGRIPSDELVEAPDNLEDENSSSEEEEDDDEEDEDDDEDDNENKEPITQSIMGWTARAGSFVAEKMALFEKLGEDSRAVLDRYLRPTENPARSEPDTDPGTLSSGGGLDEEYENSGATSGEEVWGTPTSGGELDDLPTFPNSQGDSISSPQDSNSSANCDEDDLMMDELLMAPPMTGAIVRGLLPRRILEPLMEEDDSESCTTTSAPNNQDTTPSPEQVKRVQTKRRIVRGSEYGDVADTSSAAAAPVVPDPAKPAAKTPPPPPPRRFLPIGKAAATTAGASSTSANLKRMAPEVPTSSVPRSQASGTETERGTRSRPPALIRASSYKHIIEEDSSFFSRVNHNNNVTSRMRASFSRKISSIVTNSDIEHNVIVNPSSYRSKSTRLLEFLSGRRHEDAIVGLSSAYGPPTHTTGRGERQILKLYSKDADGEAIPTSFSQRPFSPRRQNDKQLDRRFWKQLRRRRRSSMASQIPAV